ncbi:MAG: isoleucyl-tRNA synthetase [Alphaproteobacteria bacterium]|jgi:isoleucyl-tRNA synthetase
MSDNIRQTLNLPETEFPMRAGLPKREPEWAQSWIKKDIYGQLRQKSKTEGRKTFILHCGPPYANGNLHIGHALNFSLKDFVVRSKQMAGFDTVYTPGWDCHGLPIEWKIEESFKAKGKTKEDYSVKEIRDLCRDFAKGWVETQIEDGKRFGVVADFSNPYLTIDAKNEAGIVGELGKMAAKGLVYKGAKSIMWSTVEETSLAEAEVEYADKESLAIYVKFPIIDTDESIVIWTTTPWTMPTNKAVAYGADFDYVLLEATEVFEKATANVGDKVWVADSLKADFAKMVGFTAFKEVKNVKGSYFKGLIAKHPFYNQASPILEGHHVTQDGGTGFVHIAPSHGADDFEIGKKEGLDLICHVNGKGQYDDEIGDLPLTGVKLTGQVIWDAQKLIIEEMTQSGALMRWYKMKHSYPVSWRSKAPLIFRTTPQWFVALDKVAENDTATVRQTALKEIKTIGEAGGWIPAYGENRITAMLSGRPDWCISRQRAWGVPITIMLHKPSGTYTFEAEVFAHIQALVAKDGIDVWETLSVEELLPAGYLEAKGWDASEMQKETDILDVWFDSGTTYAHVVEQKMGQTLPADLYLEGSDQHRGWFNSSLTACVATNGHAPYKQVLTHGFVVDGKGKKMSKSIGNVVAPSQIQKQYGMDILRLWVAGADYNEDIRYSEEIMKGVADSYRRFRNSFRFLLGNLYDFNEAEDTVAYEDMPELEKWVLSKLYSTLEEVQTNYGKYQFRRVYELLHNFCSKELSSLYFDIRKDSLYCDPRNETAEGAEYYKRRRACQTVLMHVLKGITTHLAPVIPFTTDEVWKSAFGETAELHLEDFSKLEDKWFNAELEAKFDAVWDIRNGVNLKIDEKRNAGDVKSNLEVKILYTDNQLKSRGFTEEELADMLVISEFKLQNKDTDTKVKPLTKETGSKVEPLTQNPDYVKCTRSWKYIPKADAVEIADGEYVTKRDDIAMRTNKQKEAAA